MTPHRFFLVDVFTRRAFGGNQLAVFPEAQGLPAATMQALAREFNFAETTFVLPAGSPACAARVRIFTPRTEIPFAGHPTIGTTVVLATLGRLPLAEGGDTARLEEGVGPVAVAARLDDGPAYARLTLQPELRRPAGVPAPASVAAALSLPPSAIREIQCASVGLPFCLVHLADRTLVDRATRDAAAWSAAFAQAWTSNVFLFAGDLDAGGDLYARMFAPAMGVDEDPASGSAWAALAALSAQRSPTRDGSLRWRVEQGVRMGRPSLIEATCEKRDGRVTSVSVGGHAVIVGDGVVRLP